MNSTPSFGVDVGSSQVCKFTEGFRWEGSSGGLCAPPHLHTLTARSGLMVDGPQGWRYPMPPGPDPRLPCSPGADLFPPTPSVFAFMSLPWSQLASQAWAVAFASRSNKSGWAVFHFLSLDFGDRNYGVVIAQGRLQSTFIGKRRSEEWQRHHHWNLVSNVKIWTQDALNLPLVSGHAIFSHLNSSAYSLILLICESSRYAC